MTEACSDSSALSEPGIPSVPDPAVVNAERLHAWARSHVGLTTEIMGREARRQLAVSLREFGFEAAPNWSEAASFAAADIPKRVAAVLQPIAFTLAEDAIEVDRLAVELHRIWKLNRSEQLCELPAFEQSLSPLAQARFSSVLDVLKAESPSLLPVKCDIAKKLIDDAVSIVLSPASERATRRRELIQSRAQRTDRKKAVQIVSSQKRLAAIDDAYFAAVSGTQRNVHIGLPAGQQPASLFARVRGNLIILAIILFAVRHIYRGVADSHPLLNFSPPSMISSSQPPRSNDDVSRRLFSAQQLSRLVQSESEFHLQMSPPSPGWILPSSGLLEREECKKLLRVYSSDGIRERFKGDPTFDANREKVIATLTKRVHEFDEERRSQSLSSSEPIPVTAQDPNLASTKTPSSEETKGFGVVIELPSRPSTERDTARKWAKLFAKSGGDPERQAIFDENKNGAAPRVMVAVPSPKPDDPNAIDIRPINSADDIRQWGPKLPLAVKKALLKQFESIRLSTPQKRREIVPIISELEAQIEASEATN